MPAASKVYTIRSAEINGSFTIFPFLLVGQATLPKSRFLLEPRFQHSSYVALQQTQFW